VTLIEVSPLSVYMMYSVIKRPILYKNIRISTDILCRVFHILMEPVYRIRLYP